MKRWFVYVCLGSVTAAALLWLAWFCYVMSQVIRLQGG